RTRPLRPDRGRTNRSSGHLGSLGPPRFFRRRIYTARFPPPLLRNCDCEVRPLRGTHETVRHALDRMLRRLLALADIARAFAGDVAERAAERAEALPTGLECDLNDRQVRVAQERHGPFYAAREQIAMRRNAERILEATRKMRLGDAAHTRQARHGPVFVRRGVHAVLGAQKSAQQLRVLSEGRTCLLAADEVGSA